MNNQIYAWEKREGLIKESVWLAQGINLYREQVNKNPDDRETKTNLAKLLIRSGTDEKMHYVNLVKAQQLFEEVLVLHPNDDDALYRLGHISYEIGEFEKSITYFEKAMEQPLSDIRKFRTLATISKSSSKLFDDEKALCFMQKAKEIDKERNYYSEITDLENLIKENGHLRRSVRYSDGSTLFVSLGDIKKLKEETVDEEEAELDMSHFHPSFTGPKEATRLERKEAELLLYLIERNTRYVRKEELLMLWEEDEAPKVDTIKSYISTIKRKVGPCLSEDSGSIITNKRGNGYRWTCEVPTKIIKEL
jgi:tetratricopeptide (TPR) repeat protein